MIGGLLTMTGWLALLFAFETEVIVSLLAPAPSGSRVILLNGQSS